MASTERWLVRIRPAYCECRLTIASCNLSVFTYVKPSGAMNLVLKMLLSMTYLHAHYLKVVFVRIKINMTMCAVIYYLCKRVIFVIFSSFQTQNVTWHYCCVVTLISLVATNYYVSNSGKTVLPKALRSMFCNKITRCDLRNPQKCMYYIRECMCQIYEWGQLF